MIVGIQIVGALFSLFMAYYIFLHYKRKEFTVKESVFWFVLWALFFIVTLFPGILSPAVHTLKLVRTLDLLIILGFMFLIATIIYTYTIVRMNQKQIDEIVRKLASEKK